MRRYCTKTHRHDGVWDDACLAHRVILEAAFVIIGYGKECRLPKPFRTPGYDGPEGTPWRDGDWWSS